MIPKITKRNSEILQSKIPQWAPNIAGNLDNIKTIGCDIAQLQGQLKGRPVLLLGPGPSLDLAAPYLGHYTRDKLACMACNTALNPLAARGFIPDIVVALDPAPAVAAQIQEYISFCPKEHVQKVWLIVPVTIDPRIPKMWPGKILWFRPYDNTTPDNDAFHKTIEHQFPGLSMIGNKSNVLGLMFQVAQVVGASPILSVGFDLPVNNEACYSAVRYDLSDLEHGPVPLQKPHREMSEHLCILHQLYVAHFLESVTNAGIPFFNLSPLASFRDMVKTLPPSVIATGLEKTNV